MVALERRRGRGIQQARSTQPFQTTRRRVQYGLTHGSSFFDPLRRSNPPSRHDAIQIPASALLKQPPAHDQRPTIGLDASGRLGYNPPATGTQPLGNTGASCSRKIDRSLDDPRGSAIVSGRSNVRHGDRNAHDGHDAATTEVSAPRGGGRINRRLPRSERTHRDGRSLGKVGTDQSRPRLDAPAQTTRGVGAVAAAQRFELGRRHARRGGQRALFTRAVHANRPGGEHPPGIRPPRLPAAGSDDATARR